LDRSADCPAKPNQTVKLSQPQTLDKAAYIEQSTLSASSLSWKTFTKLSGSRNGRWVHASTTTTGPLRVGETPSGLLTQHKEHKQWLCQGEGCTTGNSQKHSRPQLLLQKRARWIAVTKHVSIQQANHDITSKRFHKGPRNAKEKRYLGITPRGHTTQYHR
jgi:hypothetical protein